MCGIRAVVVMHPFAKHRSPGLEVPQTSRPQAAKFNDLFNANRVDILKYLLRRSASSDDAADALAETFLVAWRRIDAVPEGLEGRLWLYGVARNVLLKHFTNAQRAATLNNRLATELRSVATASTNVEIGWEVRHALSQLSTSDREMVELSVWENFDPSEIASLLGISANAARVRLHRAKQRLAGILLPPEAGTRKSRHPESSEI